MQNTAKRPPHSPSASSIPGSFPPLRRSLRAQDLQVALVAIQAVALVPGHFGHQTGGLEVAQAGVDCRRSKAGVLGDPGDRGDGTLLQRAMDLVDRSGNATERANTVAILRGLVQQPLCRRHRLASRGGHRVGEEGQPRLPIPRLPHLVEQGVVLCAVRFEVEAQIQHRLRQHPLGTKQQGDEEAAQTAVAVEERVDSLELHVGQRRLHQRRRARRLIVQEPLQVPHAEEHLTRRRGHEDRIPGPRAADPVLTAGTETRDGVRMAKRENLQFHHNAGCR
jgi:hypothetical protein